MRRSIVHAAAALVVAVVLSAAIGTAAANRLETTERGFRVTSSEFTVAFAYASERYAVRCPVTLEGSFHSRTFAKVAGSLVGHVSRAAVTEASCRGFVGPAEEGEWPAKMRFLTETLPWHLTYESFSGVLPAIASIGVKLTGASIRGYELPLGGSCLFRASAEVPMRYSLTLNASGEVLALRADETAPLVPFVSGGMLCSTEGMAYAGIHAVTRLALTSKITIHLI